MSAPDPKIVEEMVGHILFSSPVWASERCAEVCQRLIDEAVRGERERIERMLQENRSALKAIKPESDRYRDMVAAQTFTIDRILEALSGESLNG